MIILNDQVVFEASDIAQFSAALQEDLVFRAGPQTTSHEYLSLRVNAVLAEATHIHDKERLTKVEDVSLVLAKADEAKLAEVKLALGITDLSK